MSEFSHLDSEGSARMVDVGKKAVVRRTATAAGRWVAVALCGDVVSAYWRDPGS